MPSKRQSSKFTKSRQSSRRDTQRVTSQLKLPVTNRYPAPHEGSNGDMMVGTVAGYSFLFCKFNGRWEYSVLSQFKKTFVNVTPGPLGPPNIPTAGGGYSHDTGWFPVKDGSDTDQLDESGSQSRYTVNHYANSDLVRAEVFCRFEGLKDGAVQNYVVNLSSHVSHSGPNSSRYGYWINMVDRNTLDLYVHPDGLTILHSENLKDSSSKTSMLISSNDTSNIGAIELRVVVSKLVSPSGNKTGMYKTDSSKNEFVNKKGQKLSTGKSVIGTGGAAVDGTKNSSFSIDSDGTGVLLKNDSGTLKARNLGDTDDAAIQAKTIKLDAGASSSSEDKYLEVHYDAANSFKLTVGSDGAFKITNRDSSTEREYIYITDQNFTFGGGNNCYWKMRDDDNSDGNDLFITSGSSHSGTGADDLDGGTLYLQSGAGTGEGRGGHIQFKIAKPAGSTGDTHNSINDTVGYFDGETGDFILYNNLILGAQDDRTTAATTDDEGAFSITTDTDDTNTAHITLNAEGDVLLDPNTGITKFQLAGDADDLCTLTVAANGATTIATVDSDGAVGDLTLDPDGDIILSVIDAEMDAIRFNVNGANNQFASFSGEVDEETKFRLYEMGGNSTTDYLEIETSEHAATTIRTVDAAASAADLIVDIDGDITLDSHTGVFIAKRAGTQFSAANSAYAGMILGYTDIGLNETRTDLSLTTGYVVPTDEHSVAFTVPPSGNVEIFMQVAFNAGSSGAGDLHAGLSSANATSGYSALQTYYEEELVDQSGRFGWETVVNSWTITGLVAGASIEYWVGFKSTSTTGTPTVSWGGDASGHYSDFIMKAIALPATITT